MFKKIHFLAALAFMMFAPILLTADSNFHDNINSILKTEHNNVQNMVDPVLKIGAVLFLVIAAFRAFQSSSVTPLLIWLGIIIVVMIGRTIVPSLSF